MRNNNCRRCPWRSRCIRCLDLFKWIPVLFISLVTVLCYYIYVVELCILIIENTCQKIFFLLVFHVLLLLYVWSYWMTIFTPLGSVPSHWRIAEADWERLNSAEEDPKRILKKYTQFFPVETITEKGSIRYCKECKHIKPDRTHHCRSCRTCVLKMDHHCPWINNCVHFANYKFFTLFMLYGWLFSIFGQLTSLQYLLRFWMGELQGPMNSLRVKCLYTVSISLSVSLAVLLGFRIYLVLTNRTTLEAFRPPTFRFHKTTFNLGKIANLKEVFGDNWKLWFLPIYSSMGDGTEFPTRSRHTFRYQSHTNPSIGEMKTWLEAQPMDETALSNNPYPEVATAITSSGSMAPILTHETGNVSIDIQLLEPHKESPDLDMDSYV